MRLTLYLANNQMKLRWIFLQHVLLIGNFRLGEKNFPCPNLVRSNQSSALESLQAPSLGVIQAQTRAFCNENETEDMPERDFSMNLSMSISNTTKTDVASARALVAVDFCIIR